MKNIIYCLLLACLSFAACTDDSGAASDGQDQQMADAIKNAPDLKPEEMAAISTQYLALKDALVQSNPANATKAAYELNRFLMKMDRSDLNSLQMYADKLNGTTELDQQREVFEHLSKEYYVLAKHNKATDQTLYRQFCPMAFDNKGAYWVSAEEEIANPYFGDKMLKCGKVTDVIE